MGFFSALGSACRSVGRTIGRGVERVGNAIGSDWLSDKGRKIQDACAEKIAEEKSYNKETSEINTTDRLNDILVSFSEGYLQQATSIENNCIVIVEQYYDQIIQLLEENMIIQAPTINIRALKKNKEKIKKEITGSIKNPLAKRMSLDDRECLAILRMDAGEDKRQKMTKFTQKVIKEALENLSKKVRETLDDNLEYVSAWLKEIWEDQDKKLKLVKEHIDKLCEQGLLETSQREIICIKPLIVLDAVDMIDHIL